MHRRTFLASASIAAATVAGCSELQGGGGGSGPSSPVSALAEAYAANDSEAARAAIHPDGPLSNDLPRTVSTRSLAIANATVVEETAGNATIRANVTIEAGLDRWNEPRRFEVRQVDGDWRIWSMQTGPEVRLREYVAAVDDGRTDEAVAALLPDSPDRQWLDETVVEATTLSLEDVSLRETWTDEATIRATIVESVGEASSERTVPVELRRSGEGWGLHTLRFGPVLPVFRFVRGYREADLDLVREAVHPDTELEMPENEHILDLFDRFVIDAISVASIDETEATVDATLTIAALGETQTSETRFSLRPHGGVWTIDDTAEPP